MLKNYIVSAWRGARQDISGFLINIIGLLVGFTVFTLAYSFVHYINNFDTSFTAAERTYSLNLRLSPGNFFRRESVPFAFTGAIDGLKERAPEIELAGRVTRNQAAYEKDGVYLPFNYYAVDEDILPMFDVNIIKGSAEAFIGQLDVALLSEREALHFFGADDPIGQTININNQRSVVVVGIFENLPANSHLMVNGDAREAFDFLVSTEFYEKLSGSSIRDSWDNIRSSVTNYIVAKEGIPVRQVNDILTQHLLANIDEESRATFIGMGTTPITTLQKAAFARDGVDLVLVTRIAGALILGLAVLNAISLASARMITRSREIGIRRVFGARRRDLTLQYITENTVYALVALGLSFLFAFDLFAWIAELTGLELVFSQMIDWQLILGLLATAGLVGLISSIYPIMLFSGVLKSVSLSRTLTLASSAAWLRKALVTSQFLVVTTLILTFIVVQMQNQHLFDNVHKIDSNRMAVIDDLDAPGMSEIVANTVKSLPGVKSVSRNNLPPFSGNTNITIMNIQGLGEGMQFRTVSVDSLYFDQLGIKLLAGRMLDETRDVDFIAREERRDTAIPRNFVINQSAMRTLGFEKPEDIIGHTFIELTDGEEPSAAERTIVGVVRDTRLGLPTGELMPTIYSVNESRLGMVTVLYEAGAPIDITALNKAWQAVDPAALARVTPLSDMAARELLPFERARQGFMLVTLVTVTMAAAGLYALTAYLAASKKREVSIRKVYGAPISRILQFLMWQFTKPVSLAILVGLPLAFYVLQTQYLTMFTERVELGILPVAATILLVLLTAWVTVFAHILRAAKARPAEVLRGD